MLILLLSNFEIHCSGQDQYKYNFFLGKYFIVMGNYLLFNKLSITVYLIPVLEGVLHFTILNIVYFHDICFHYIVGIVAFSLENS